MVLIQSVSIPERAPYSFDPWNNSFARSTLFSYRRCPDYNLNRSDTDPHSCAFMKRSHSGVLFHRLMPCSGSPANSGIAGAKVGAGSCDFWGFHNCGALRSACQCFRLVVYQSGSRPGYVDCTIDQLLCDVLSFMVGLPFGPVGVAIAFSVTSLLVRLPIFYFNVGRRGPVRTADLWRIFFRHLPLWVVVFALTWLMLAMVANLARWLNCSSARLLESLLALPSSACLSRSERWQYTYSRLYGVKKNR